MRKTCWVWRALQACLLTGVIAFWAGCGAMRPAGSPFFQPAGGDGEEEQTIAELVVECQRNLRASPVDAQRSCRRALTMIEMDAVPEMYGGEKRRAQSLLGRSYYATGRIAEASAFLDSVLDSTPSEEDPLALRASELRDEIDRLFRPLRITVADRQIPVLAYIKGVDLEIEYPRRLTKEQRIRLDNLERSEWRAEDEFQFVGIDEQGRAYMELGYFPIVTFTGARGYSLIVEGRHRYRFNFTPESDEVQEILWEPDAGWELIERVPEERVKLELPGDYLFVSESGPDPLVLEYAGKVHMYVPSDGSTQLVMSDSKQRAWERAYDYLLYAATGTAGLLALLGAR